jgi:hypothetical protein
MFAGYTSDKYALHSRSNAIFASKTLFQVDYIRINSIEEWMHDNMICWKEMFAIIQSGFHRRI